MKNFFVVIIIVLGSILTFVAINKNNKEIVKPTELHKVRVAYKKSVPSFPIFVGIEEGYFREQNLEIEPVVFESTNQMIEAVVRGDVDASAVGAVEPVLAVESVSPGNFKFYGQVQWSKNNFLDYVLVQKNSPISKVQDLKGKKIGVAPGGASVIYTKLFLQHFFDPNDVSIEQLDPKNLVQALAAGSVDAVVGNEPLGTIAIQKRVARVLLERPYTDYVPYLPEITGVGLLSSKFIRERPDIAKKFTAVMEKSFEYGNGHPDQVKEILPSCCGVSEEVAPKIPHLGVYSGSNAIDKTVLQQFADFLSEQELIEKKIDTADLLF